MTENYTETRRKQSLIYLAGMIDADGCIAVTKCLQPNSGARNPTYRLQVTVTNTSKVLMDWLTTNFKGTVYARKMPADANWKQCYSWVINGLQAREILKNLEEYLVVKKDRALLGIELLDKWVVDNRGTSKEEVARRESIYRKFRELNEVGLVQRERLNPEAPSTEG